MRENESTCDREKQRHVSRVTAARNGAPGVISLIRHLSRIFMSLNNPKAARIFTWEIKSTSGRELFIGAVSAKFILPRVGADICIYISSRSFGARCNNNP